MRNPSGPVPSGSQSRVPPGRQYAGAEVIATDGAAFFQHNQQVAQGGSIAGVGNLFALMVDVLPPQALTDVFTPGEIARAAGVSEAEVQALVEAVVQYRAGRRAPPAPPSGGAR